MCKTEICISRVNHLITDGDQSADFNILDNISYGDKFRACFLILQSQSLLTNFTIFKYDTDITLLHSLSSNTT